MKVTIITVCFNSKKFIKDTINSVLNQSYTNIEYIIIDGGSNDGTIDIVNSFGSKISKFISEPDQGIYDAINKGIKLSSGEIIGILNSDDFFCNDRIIDTIVNTFLKSKADVVYGDVKFVNFTDVNKIVRYYSSKSFCTKKFRFGFMPAHPSIYVKKKIFGEIDLYKTDYLISSDFEFSIRLFSANFKFKYINMPIVTMRLGGVSNKSLKNIIILNKEIMKACKENGIKTNFLFLYSKYLKKIFEFFSVNPFLVA